MSGPGTVTAEISLRLLASPGHRVPVAATLSYTAADPYAIRADFHVGLDEPVRWVFARDLLRDGIEAPAGQGDVRIWPSPGGEVLAIEVASPFGQARFETPAADVAGFLCGTEHLVPEGAEILDFDAGLTGLLRAAAPPGPRPGRHRKDDGRA